MRVISISRRTDIPAFYTRWFVERIRSGFCDFMNPFSGKIYRVSLRPEDVIALVFWTRNAAPLLPYADGLWRQGYRFYFQYTITGYPGVLEGAAPPVAEAVDSFRRTADAMASPGLVQWRYDPIVISSATPTAYHLERFYSLCRSLEGYTQRCYISFAQFYAKTQRNLRKLEPSGLSVADPGPEERADLAQELSRIASSRGISVYACCSSGLVTGSGCIRQASCIDSELVERLRPDLNVSARRGPTREGCGCMESTDIGAFDTCVHGCAYCYATTNPSAARGRYSAHDPKDTILYRPGALKGVDLADLAKPLTKPHTRADTQGQLSLFGGDGGE